MFPPPYASLRPKEDPAVKPSQFRLAGGDELLDDHLGTVGVIADLATPITSFHGNVWAQPYSELRNASSDQKLTTSKCA